MANMTQFSINITTGEEAPSDLQNASLLTIRLFLTDFVIEIKRSYEATAALLRTLQNDSTDASPSEKPEELLSTAQLEAAFSTVFASRAEQEEEPWDSVPLIEFLDGQPLPACLTSATVALMKNKIKMLDLANKASSTRIKDLEGKFASIAGQVQSIQSMLQIQYREHELHKQMYKASSGSFADSNDFHATDAALAGVELDCDSEAEEEVVQVVHANTTLGGSTSSPPDTLSALALDTPLTSSSADLDPVAVSPPLSSGSKFNPAAPAFNPSAPAFNPKATAVPRSPSGNNPTALPTSALLSSALYQELPHDEAMQRAAMDFIHALCPQQAQVHYRDSVVALIQRNFRSSLNCESLEVGLHRLLCFLPDDPIKVSAVVCRNHSTKWHRIICDRLNMISKKRSDDQGAQEGYTYRNDRPDEEDSGNDHIIRNVLISNTKLCIQVQCSVDNTEVELTCNSRAEVCMLALLEEVNTLVGKNDLFKHSLMLIRAWWCCESAAYVGTTVKNYISDLAVCVMVCAIFNQHHALIHSPLQALCAFLAEYSTYDGSTCAISIMGIVPFKSTSSNQPVLPAPLNPLLTAPLTGGAASKLLLTRDVLEKYWLLFCPPDPANPEQQLTKIIPTLSTSSEDVFGIDLPGIPTVNFSLDIASSAGSSLNDSSKDAVSLQEDTTGLSLEEAALAAHRQQCNRNLIKFDRSQFNIVDPFSCNNMVLERPSQNRILRLTKVFQSGATQMSALLTQAQSTSDNFDARATLKTFFPMSTVRFVDSSTRPDTFSVDASFLTPAMIAQMTRRIPMKVSVDELARQMRYCNLMVESVISRTAVLDLVVEILTQKGPLPIGEVGKALAELTCITGLSARLKEAYGGLKKFLEDYSNVVIIGSDHPFNPHIVLRSSLSPENLALNDSGVFPTHAVLRMKKVTATSLRKNAFQSKPGIPVAGIPQHQGYRTGGPMTTAGIGMGAQGPDYRGPPPQRPMYPDQRMGGQVPQQNHQYGQQQMQQPLPPPHTAGQQHYTAKILSNLHADARDREMAGYRPQQGQQQQQQQHAPLQGMHNGLERHGSGSSHGSHNLSHGSMTGSHSHNSSGHMFQTENGMSFSSSNNSVTSGSNDAYEEVIGLGISNSPNTAYNKPYAPNAPLSVRDPQYPPQHGQQPQYHSRTPPFPEQGMDGSRSRGNSADLLAGSRGAMRGAAPAYPSPHAAPRQSDVMGHAFQQQPYPQQAYGYDRNAPSTGMTGGSPRDRYSSGSPTAPAAGFAIDTSFFESSAGMLMNEQYAPLESSRSSNAGNFHQRSSSSGSIGSIGGGIGGIGLERYEQNLSVGAPASGASRHRVGSLLSGLREGTVELPDQGSRDWDLFPPPQQQDFLSGGGGSEWRAPPAGQSDRRY